MLANRFGDHVQRRRKDQQHLGLVRIEVVNQSGDRVFVDLVKQMNLEATQPLHMVETCKIVDVVSVPGIKDEHLLTRSPSHSIPTLKKSKQHREHVVFGHLHLERK